MYLSMEESKRSPGSASGPHQPLSRSSSSRSTSGGFRRSVRRVLRSSSRAFRHSRSIKPAEAPAASPSPSPAVNPDPTDGAGTGAGRGLHVTGSSRRDGGAGAGSTGSKETSIETQKDKDEKKKRSGWTALFRPVTGLVKAYINFMMRPTPDEDGYTPASHIGSNPTLGVHSSRAPSPGPSPRATPGSASRSHPAAYRPSQSGPIPARHRQRQPSVRRYPHSGPLPGAHDRSHLVHSDSRRYSGELRKDGELLKRRTAEEVERDAVVGQAVVFGPGKPTPPPKERVVEEEEEDIEFILPPLPTSAYAPRLFAVAEEAGTPRGISLR